MHNLPKCIITNVSLFIFPKLSDLFLSVTFILRLVILCTFMQMTVL